MKRLWAAAAILAVLLGGTLWNAWYAERLTGGMIQQLKQAQERTAQGDWEGAAELSEQAFQSWQTMRRISTSLCGTAIPMRF